MRKPGGELQGDVVVEVGIQPPVVGAELGGGAERKDCGLERAQAEQPRGKGDPVVELAGWALTRELDCELVGDVEAAERVGGVGVGGRDGLDSGTDPGVERLESDRRMLFERGYPARLDDADPGELIPVSMFRLLDALKRALDRQAPPIVHTIVAEPISLEEAIGVMESALRRRPRTRGARTGRCGPLACGAGRRVPAGQSSPR